MKNSQSTAEGSLVPGIGRIPYPAYRGSEPYIFLSYAHKNAQQVYRQIQLLNELGYRVWYDEGIAPGNEWTDEIAAALEKSALFLVFITPESAASENVQNEINFALDEKKPFLAVHLEETELKGGVKLQISTKQAILYYTMTQEEYVYKLTSAFERMGLSKAGDVESADALTSLTPPGAKRRARLIAAAVGCLAALGVALFFLLRGGGGAPAPEASPTLIPGASQAGKRTEDGFQYTLFSDHVEITGYDPTRERLTVPETIEGLPVTALSAMTNLFVTETDLVSVTLPDTVTALGPYAFANSKNLTQITLSKNLMEIGDGAFSGCVSLKEISLPDSLRVIGVSAFMECGGLDGIALPQGLQEIRDYAFYYCTGLKTVALPQDLRVLGMGAFSLCTALESINLPAAVTAIPTNLLQGDTALKTVALEGEVTAVGDWAFYFCASLQGLSLPDSVASIGEYAFYGCSSLEKLTLPAGLTHLGPAALASCVQLRSLTFPEGVTALSDSLLMGCKRLSKAVLPAGLARIGEAAFDGCATLAAVEYGGTREQWLQIEIGEGNDALNRADIQYAL